MSDRSVARLIKLRESERGPVFGVRTRLTCQCGLSFPVTLTAGVDRPAIWCPGCRRRSVLEVVWRLDGRLEEGAVVQFDLGGLKRGS